MRGGSPGHSGRHRLGHAQATSRARTGSGARRAGPTGCRLRAVSTATTWRTCRVRTADDEAPLPSWPPDPRRLAAPPPRRESRHIHGESSFIDDQLVDFSWRAEPASSSAARERLELRHGAVRSRGCPLGKSLGSSGCGRLATSTCAPAARRRTAKCEATLGKPGGRRSSSSPSTTNNRCRPSSGGAFRGALPQRPELVEIHGDQVFVEQVRELRDHRAQEPAAVRVRLPAGQEVGDDIHVIR